MPVDPRRLESGGDIAESYSADRITERKAAIRKPFDFRGGLWVCTGKGAIRWNREETEHTFVPKCDAYRIVPLAKFEGVATTYNEKICGDDDAAERARNDPLGFYHGITVSHRGAQWVMVGPEVEFWPADPEEPAVGQLSLF